MDENIEKMKEYQKVIREILSAFQNVSFPIIVESSTGFRVISVDKKDDENLIEDMSYIANTVSRKYYKNLIDRALYKKIIGKLPKSFRPNEVSRIVEYEIPTISNKFKVINRIIPLKQSGYPDIKVIENSGRIIFVDIKVTTRPEVGSPRNFFYSPQEKTIEKIDSDGIHLLLGFVIKEAKPGQFSTTGWKIVDLSKIKVSMKAEFNADNIGIYKPEAILAEEWLEV